MGIAESPVFFLFSSAGVSLTKGQERWAFISFLFLTRKKAISVIK